MKCPRCSNGLAATVIPTRWDGDFNYLVCGCGYATGIIQAKPCDILDFRAKVGRLLEAA